MVDKTALLTGNAANIEEFRANGGRLAAFGDAPVLLLTTKGAQSRESRTSPLMYLADDTDPNLVYVFASYAGADVDPSWYRNLVAHPDDVRVEIGDESLRATAEVLGAARRAEVFAEQAARYAQFAEYEAKTSRTIPVVALRLDP
jgi:deazaflavin-dependent oxidoreductase (nitroreductase family)